MNHLVPVFLLAATVGCQSDSKPTDETTASASKPAKGEDSEKPTRIDAAAFAPVLAKYELVRANLAKDDAGVGPNASALADAVDSLKKSGAPAASDLGALGDAARRLSKTSGEDIDAARKGFGEVSKALVEFLGKHPDLQSGLHVFECPMTPTYKKWVQPAEGLENPYMGAKMPGCGGKSDWAS